MIRTGATVGAPLAIALRQLVFHYDGAPSPALSLDKLEVEVGQHWFVEGSSGCGKSTLLGLLSGVLVSQTGELSILGKWLGGMSGSERDRFRADHIGYIFQQFNLIPYLSVVENVTLPLRFSERRRSGVEDPESEALRLLGHLDMGEFVDRKVTDLSVGQQQRVAAARALIGGPELVLADEPTSSLDEGNGERFIDLLFEECERVDATLVFVSHDPRLSKPFRHRLKLEGGQA